MHHSNKNTNKHTHGFVSLSCIFVIAILIGLYFTVSFSIGISEARNLAQSQCVQQASETQGQVLKTLRELFNLNPLSTALRLQIQSLQAQIVAATLAQNYAALPGLSAQLTEARNEQLELNQIQKSLIFMAQSKLQSGHIKLLTSLNKNLLDQNQRWKDALSLVTSFVAQREPKVAIRPDSQSGIAPNYEWQTEAEQIQAMSYSWSLYFTTQERVQRYLSWTNKINLSCLVAPQVKGEQWQLKINVGKPS